MKMFVVFWITVMLYQRAVAVLYNKSSCHLDYFPMDIPSDVEAIDLTDNNITSVDSVPIYPFLGNLSLALNLLTEFPDLVNVSDTLSYLDLSSNMIQFIQPELLDQLHRLELLGLGDNPLTSVPDVPGPSETLYHLGLGYTDLEEFPVLPNLGRNLWTLYLHGTRIESVPLVALSYLPLLDYMLLFDTRIKEMPNLCSTQREAALSVDVSRVTFDCNLNFIWLKVAVASKHVLLVGESPSCRKSDGTLISWSEANVNQLTDSGVGQAYYDELLDKATFHCPLRVQSAIEATPRGCASLCLRQSDCPLFAADAGQCLLTSLKAGDADTFDKALKWFVVSAK